MTTNLYISTKNKENDTKLSEYDPRSQPRSSMLSRMTLSSKCPIMNPQCCQSTPLGVKNLHSWRQKWPCLPCVWSETLNILQVPPSWPPLLDILLIEISTQNFQGIFLGVKEHHLWCQEWPCSPCLQSGTLNVLQVPSSLTPPSWQTSNWDINMKFSGYDP